MSDILTSSRFVGTGSTTNAVDLGSDEVAGILPSDKFEETVTIQNLIVTKSEDYDSNHATLVSGSLACTAPEMVVSAQADTSPVDALTNITGTAGRYLLRPATGHTITVDGTGNIDISGASFVMTGHDVIFIMHIGAGEYIEISRSDNT